MEPATSLCNELVCLSTGYAVSPDTWFLQEMVAVLRAADEDLKDTPPPENDYTLKFVDPMEHEWDDRDSSRLLGELSNLWSDAFDATGSQCDHGLVTIERLTQIKKEFVGQDVHLEYHHLRLFILAVCFDLQQQQEVSPVTTEAIILNALARTRIMLGPSESKAPSHVSIDAADVHLLRALRKILHGVVDAGNMFDKAMKDSTGDQANRSTVQDVWEKYADSLDIDAAKKSWMELARMMLAADAHKAKGICGMVEDVVGLLDRLNLGEDSPDE